MPSQKPERRGIVLILSSPSGAGKTTLTRMLLQDRRLDLTLSI
ncbi:MAG TPA: guanylate kinase, partial [Methylocystis sp.]|nr:guanylate kinase [Methylocystis sp.]